MTSFPPQSGCSYLIQSLLPASKRVKNNQSLPGAPRSVPFPSPKPQPRCSAGTSGERLFFSDGFLLPVGLPRPSPSTSWLVWCSPDLWAPRALALSWDRSKRPKPLPTAQEFHVCPQVYWALPITSWRNRKWQRGVGLGKGSQWTSTKGPETTGACPAKAATTSRCPCCSQPGTAATAGTDPCAPHRSPSTPHPDPPALPSP